MSSIGLNTGLKALLSARFVLDTIGHNIANANTPGYSRQRVQLASALPLQMRGLLIGSGVDAGAVERTVDELLGRRILAQRGVMGSLDAQRTSLSQVEALFAEPGENGLGTLLDGFFSSLAQLSTSPADSILRADVVQSTQSMTERFHELSRSLTGVSVDAFGEVSTRVDEANRLAAEIAKLNLEIGETESTGVPANDLRDRRSVALERLSQIVDVTTVGGPNGAVRVLVEGNTLVGTARANALEVTTDAAGELALSIEGSSGFVPVEGGEIGGLLRLSSELAPSYRTRLDQLAHELIREANRVHSTGLPVGGSFRALVAQNQLEDFDGDGRVTDELLANAGLPFEIVTGSLAVNVSDQASGTITKHRIDVDATHTTVQDFVDALNEIAHVSANLDSSGVLRIQADSGFGFDFSRRIDGDPDPAGTFGGARASMGTALAGPFALADGDTLALTVDSGGVPVSFQVAFDAADFEEISQASAEEIAIAINADAGAQANGIVATTVEGRLFLQTAGGGADASFTLDGGTALGALGWTAGTDVDGQANAVEAKLSGVYTGELDRSLVFRPTMDGTIGTTEGLEVEVLDADGTLLATLDVGAGYAPGTELVIADGVSVSFGLGELSATHGDLFAAELVVDSDTSDVLVGLGLNALFSGSGAGDIALSAEIEADPSRIAVSLTGAAGDGSVLLELVGIEDRGAAGLDAASVGRFWGDLVGDVGFEIGLVDSALQSNEALIQSLEQRRAAVSGVNVDEELVDLVAYEQSFAAAAQYISVVNQLGEELLSLV